MWLGSGVWWFGFKINAESIVTPEHGKKHHQSSPQDDKGDEKVRPHPAGERTR